jgi:hypothetical protein
VRPEPQVVKLLALLLAGCAFDPSGLASRPDAGRGDAAAAKDAAGSDARADAAPRCEPLGAPCGPGRCCENVGDPAGGLCAPGPANDAGLCH